MNTKSAAAPSRTTLKLMCAALRIVFLGSLFSSALAAAETAAPTAPAAKSEDGSRSVIKPAAADGKTTLLVVVGAAGEESYGRIFEEETALWRKVAAASEVRLELVGEADLKPGVSDKDRLQKILQAELREGSAAAPLWIIFIGHGTFDGREAAFNLRGPDATSAELTEWLAGAVRPTVVVNTTAASAPFLTALSAPGRVVITATKSAQERNYARFGRYFARRVIDPAADLDKDDQTSLFEAFLAAARDTAEFYKSEGRIATEHPLLDDDGDAKGVRADFFERGKLVKRPAAGQTVDGDRARGLGLKPSAAEQKLSPRQRAERDKLERELAALRLRKPDPPDDAYFAELERLLVALARLYEGLKP